MSDARTATQVAHDGNMFDGLDNCLVCGASGQWEGACPSCGVLAVDIAGINYLALTTDELYEIRDAASIVINQRKATPPWYGIYVESEAAWLTPNFLPTNDVEKAIKRRKVSTLEGWRASVWFRDKCYKGVQVLELPITTKDSDE